MIYAWSNYALYGSHYAPSAWSSGAGLTAIQYRRWSANCLEMTKARGRGESYPSIAERFDLAPWQVMEIVRRTRVHFKSRRPPVPSRAVDMGGPRDQWLEWTPETQQAEFAGGGR